MPLVTRKRCLGADGDKLESVRADICAPSFMTVQLRFCKLGLGAWVARTCTFIHVHVYVLSSRDQDHGLSFLFSDLPKETQDWEKVSK